MLKKEKEETPSRAQFNCIFPSDHVEMTKE